MDQELLETRTDLSLNVRNALRITIEEKQVIHELFDSIKQVNDLF